LDAKKEGGFTKRKRVVSRGLAGLKEIDGLIAKSRI